MEKIKVRCKFEHFLKIDKCNDAALGSIMPAEGQSKNTSRQIKRFIH